MGLEQTTCPYLRDGFSRVENVPTSNMGHSSTRMTQRYAESLRSGHFGRYARGREAADKIIILATDSIIHIY